MVVAIFRSLEGESLEDFSIRLAEKWRIGQKGLDNGVVLLVFAADRKLRMEVGYGLEPVLPDAVAGQIIREAITPRFREGRYAAGLEAAVAAVFARVEGKPATGARPAGRGAPGTDWSTWLPVAFLLFVIVSLALNTAWRARHAHHAYTAGPRGWYRPSVPIFFPPMGGGGGGGGDGGFSGGGGFGGGGASGDW